MLINCRKDGWSDDWWTEKWCSSWSALYLSAQVLEFLLSLFHSFLCNILFSPDDELLQHTMSHISPCIPLFLCISIMSSVSLRLTLYLRSLYTTALVLLCISSAGFEAIAVHDHYQTRTKEKVGEREGDEEMMRWREIKSKRQRSEHRHSERKRDKEGQWPMETKSTLWTLFFFLSV